jgi:hypothetical protein
MIITLGRRDQETMGKFGFNFISSRFESDDDRGYRRGKFESRGGDRRDFSKSNCENRPYEDNRYENKNRNFSKNSSSNNFQKNYRPSEKEYKPLRENFKSRSRSRRCSPYSKRK